MNLDKVFDFIKDKRGYEYPFLYKLLNDIPLSEDDLNVRGDLTLYDSNLDTLPNKLTIMGDLLMSDSSFKKIPNGLKIYGDMYILNTPCSRMFTDKEIKKIIKDYGGFVKGTIYT